MLRHFAATLLLAALVLAVAPANARTWRDLLHGRDSEYRAANYNLMIGHRSLDSDEWAPTNSLWQLGAEYDYRKEEWPVNFCAAAFFATSNASAQGVDVKLQIYELQVGAKKLWLKSPRFNPYVGLGASALYVDHRAVGTGRAGGQEVGVGGWGSVGFHIPVAERFQVGLDARYSWVPTKVNGEDTNPGGVQINLLVGYHWTPW